MLAHLCKEEEEEDLTEHFAFLELLHPLIIGFYVVQKSRSTDFEALKLSNVRSGKKMFAIKLPNPQHSHTKSTPTEHFTI